MPAMRGTCHVASSNQMPRRSRPPPTCTPSSRCRIAQRARDAVGHQLESKLSCVAAAALLGLDYVDIPFVRVRGWDASLEGVVDFAQAFPSRPPGAPTHHRRPGSSSWWPLATGPLETICGLTDIADSWFRKIERRNVTCCNELICARLGSFCKNLARASTFHSADLRFALHRCGQQLL